MGTERYECSEGTSNKFWEIELAGTKYAARWGRIGGSISSNEKAFATVELAQKAAAKAVAEKLAKGYIKVGGKTAKPTAARSPTKAGSRRAELEANLAEDRNDKGNLQVYADHLIELGEPWGEVINHACAGKNIRKRLANVEAELLGDLDGSGLAWKNGLVARIYLQPEEHPEELEGELAYPQTLERILRHPAGRLVDVIELGLPPLVRGEIRWNFERLVDAIAAAGPLPLLRSLDLTSDAEHMDQDSWRRIGDIRKLWKAAPRLRSLRMKGSNGSDGGPPIKLGTIDAPELQELVYISSGLDKSAPVDIGKATLPQLRHLELYFGKKDYGNTCSIRTLAGILAGRGLPSLAYLGLVNSEWEAELVEAVASSAIIKRISTLDLSQGVFYEEGPAALIEHAAKLRHLQRIKLHENYIVEHLRKPLKRALPNVMGLDEQRELDDEDDAEWRYPAIGE